MNIHDFAKMLDGREVDAEITKAEEKQAKELGFVVLFGESDDLAELRGAIDDEAGCYDDDGDGGTIYFTEKGIFEECANECSYSNAAKKKCKTIEAIWGKGGYAWIYNTNIPHAEFDILEDGEKYCRGIVFDIKSL